MKLSHMTILQQSILEASMMDNLIQTNLRGEGESPLLLNFMFVNMFATSTRSLQLTRSLKYSFKKGDACLK